MSMISAGGMIMMANLFGLCRVWVTGYAQWWLLQGKFRNIAALVFCIAPSGNPTGFL
ncbi:hypothetical protein [Pseudomonas sp. Teo4]|uniref:hypothetical protein n=1 Tax=Pseudomonas sp. Teo4 TaxID=3064528 RepID=UPI002ACB0B85|nr:hypothetical protein [Pseudomonas sp. Teo4]